MFRCQCATLLLDSIHYILAVALEVFKRSHIDFCLPKKTLKFQMKITFFQIDVTCVYLCDKGCDTSNSSCFQ